MVLLRNDTSYFACQLIFLRDYKFVNKPFYKIYIIDLSTKPRPLNIVAKVPQNALQKRIVWFVGHFQSAYRQAHSTETALVCVQNDILRAIDNQHAVFMLLLDLSAAFDTVDHEILLQRLDSNFGLTGTVKNWFHSYLCGRSCKVRVRDALSEEVNLEFGVPQGSVIGPQLFTLYIHSIGDIIRQHSISYHIYADDVQLYISFNPNIPGDAACALFRLSNCVSDLHAWLINNKFKLNSRKTEFFIASSKNHYKVLENLVLHLDGQIIKHSPTIRNLGVVFDHDMSMSAHITHLSRSINWQVRCLSRIRKFLDFDTCNNVVRALLLSRLDYCNSLLNGISKNNMGRIQKLQNKCARLVCCKPKYCHITPLLRLLHWLPISQRIQFRILVQTFTTLQSSHPSYISSLLILLTYSYSLRSVTGSCLFVPKSNKLVGDKSFSSTAPRLWNNLPSLLRNANSSEIFKKLLKSHLFPK